MNQNSLSIENILAYLPHRYPFLLVDRVLDIDCERQHISAIKNVSFNEPFFQGHFPGAPVMPGVLLIEAMAQAGGLLGLKLLESEGEDAHGRLVYFMSIDEAKFRKPVVPGDQVRFEVQMHQRKRNIMKQRAEAWIGDQLACEAWLKAMIRSERSRS